MQNTVNSTFFDLIVSIPEEVTDGAAMLLSTLHASSREQFPNWLSPKVGKLGILIFSADLHEECFEVSHTTP